MSPSMDGPLLSLMKEIEAGKISASGALARWHQDIVARVGSEDETIHLDLSRGERSGFPEVIFAEGKTDEDLCSCIRQLAEASPRVLATRVSESGAAMALEKIPQVEWHHRGRILTIGSPGPRLGVVTVIAAGTTDVPVAEEAAMTAWLMGAEVRKLYDVGVAGLHRLLSRKEELVGAGVHIVVAGMEGALPSVVGGLVAEPVIAVPTAVGYGASFQGLAALLGMLCSCAPGVVVVNIGNGFGAAYAACRILRTEQRQERRIQT